MRRIAALIAVLASAGGLALASPSGAATAPLRYVAMGDSYSAASGNIPPDPTAAPQCLRSTVNYPHVIAAKLGATLTDVTCGGADTSDYATGQYPGVAPQLNALQPNTQLVTMTIGGNDSSVFIDSILECGAAGLSHPRSGQPVQGQVRRILRQHHPEHDVSGARGGAEVGAGQGAACARRDPGLSVDPAGDRGLLPADAGGLGRRPYLRDEQATLNDAVRRAAAATSVTYVDMSKVSNGHDACQAVGVRWIEPVLFGTNPVIVHPNPLGESQLAAQTLKVLHLG